MALFYYEAFSADGKKIKGQLDASSESSAKDQLSKKGVYVVSIRPFDKSYDLPWYKKLLQKKVTLKDKILFTKQLSVLLKSGIPLLQSLELLIDQFDGQLKYIIISIKDGIKEGGSFADGLKKYPKIFDNIYIQLVRAGEATGNLELILDRLSLYLERREDIQRRVKSALSQPIIQLVVVFLVVAFLVTFVVPKLTGMFAQQGADLPAPTKILLGISDFIRFHYFILLFIVSCVVGLFVYVRSQEWGQLLIDKIKLKLPIIKYFTRTSAIIQFSRTLGMLLESGVNLSEALDIVCNIINNKVLASALKAARDKIIKEGKITTYLSETKIFPPMAIYLLRTGENSGELAHMLLVVGQNYETELTEVTDGLSAKIGPFMLVFMAVLVGFIVISIALPIMNMSSLVGI